MKSLELNEMVNVHGGWSWGGVLTWGCIGVGVLGVAGSVFTLGASLGAAAVYGGAFCTGVAIGAAVSAI